MQVRHGDVMLETVEQIPENNRKVNHTILAHGEITGHSHRIMEKGAATLFETPQGLFLEVVEEPATLVHEEHQPISLKVGIYRVWRQREYSPEEIRIIRD